MDTLKKTKILGIVGALLLIIGNFFPFVTIKFWGQKGTVNFIEGDGIVTFILGLIALALIFIDFIIAKIPEGKMEFLSKLRNPKFLLVPAIISAIILFMDRNSLDIGHAGLGFYMLILGIIALVVFPFLYKGEEN